MSIKDYLERKLKKHASFTVYSPANIPLGITTEDYILCEGTAPLSFDMDCEDLAEYCEQCDLHTALTK